MLILDKPTSVLTPQEAEALFQVLDQMTDEGKAVIFISHKLDEVMRIANAVTVLRKGAVVGNLTRAEASPSKLAELMIGRTIEAPSREGAPPQEQAVLELDDVWVRSLRWDQKVDEQGKFRTRNRVCVGQQGISLFRRPPRIVASWMLGILRR